MRVFKAKPGRVFGVAIAFLMMGVLLQWFLSDRYNASEYYTSLIESSLEREVTKLEQEMIPVLDSASNGNLIQSNFNAKTSYPYYIYRNGQIKIWSDYHIVPDYSDLNGTYQYKAKELNNSLYVIRKWFVENLSGTFEVFALIPIRTSFSLKNRYLQDIYNPKIFQSESVSLLFSKQKGFTPIILKNTYLFSVNVGKNYRVNNSFFNVLLGIIYSLALISFTLGLILWYLQFRIRNKLIYGVMLIVAYWIVLKFGMFIFEFPETVLRVDVFNSQFFAVSWFERSFGDMMLNTIFLLIIALFLYLRISKFKTRKLKGWERYISVMAILAMFFIPNYLYLQLRAIYHNSQISLDITQSLQFGPFKVFTLLVFVIISLSSFLYFHLLIRYYLSIKANLIQKTIDVVVAAILFTGISLAINLPLANMVLPSIILLVILEWSALPLELPKANYKAVLYFLLFIIFDGLVGAWCISKFEHQRELDSMKLYAQELTQDNDYMAEFMIDESLKEIQKDPFIASRLGNPFLSNEVIVKKIRRIYLNRYLNKYSINVFLYYPSGEGLPHFGSNARYQDIKKRFANDHNKTEFQSIFLIRNTRGIGNKRYIAFVPIFRNHITSGYVVMEFRQKRLVPTDVYPELLKDNRFTFGRSRDYPYALFVRGQLVQSHDSYEYHLLDISSHHDNEPWLEMGYWHLKISGAKNNVVVVSQVDESLNRFVSNLSFLILVLLFPTGLVLAGYGISGKKRESNLSYTAKIQTFLNLAFLTPLIVVTLTTLSLISSSFKTELVENKIGESKNLASKIASQLDGYLIGVGSREELTGKLLDMASYGQIDASIYGVDGALITTTQPDIFATGLLSGFVNPAVREHIIEHDDRSQVEEENIGKLTYFATYAGIKTEDTDRLIGVLEIPFFNTQTTLEHSRIKALTTIFNLFVLIFIVALLTTYLTSKWLTSPLSLIRKQFERISFAKRNEPLNWESDDEIGMLVRDYNRMLVNLEESREALARSQKETAWREVAQQVAHELKNPLTPMKLTMQQLMRTGGGNGVSKEKIKPILNNLLNQLNILNDIVTSFSDFAKMPIPKSEKVDIISLLEDTSAIFSNDPSVEIELHLHTITAYITADSKLMGRIISNMIINASQSRKPEQEVVHIRVSSELMRERAMIRVAIQDDGAGIPDQIRERVFIPKFSTKEKGSGIGLAIAKHGIEQIGGTIWFESTEKDGTTFIMELPMAG